MDLSCNLSTQCTFIILNSKQYVQKVEELQVLIKISFKLTTSVIIKTKISQFLDNLINDEFFRMSDGNKDDMKVVENSIICNIDLLDSLQHFRHIRDNQGEINY